MGTLRIQYNEVLGEIVDSNHFTNIEEALISAMYNNIDALDKVYKATNNLPLVNEEDPITLEPIENGISWFENGKRFAMNRKSLIEYVKKFKYVDEKGITQIPNCVTQEPIPDPWRTDFLYMANLK